MPGEIPMRETGLVAVREASALKSRRMRQFGATFLNEAHIFLEHKSLHRLVIPL